LANSKSAKKRVRTNERNRLRNLSIKTNIKTTVKKFLVALTVGKDEAQLALVNAQKTLDKAVTKGILKKNTASRKKSRLTVKFNKTFAA